jgi:hypothetical protein
MTDEPRSGSDRPAAPDPQGGGRRGGDRRTQQVPYDGPERRKGERRSASDRRATPRSGDGA